LKIRNAAAVKALFGDSDEIAPGFVVDRPGDVIRFGLA